MNPTLISKLKHLRLSGMAEALAVRLAQAEAAPLPHLEFLELLVEDELHRRADRLFSRRLKQGEIVQIKELKDFDWAFNPKIPKAKIAELTSARFVTHHEDLLEVFVRRHEKASTTVTTNRPTQDWGSFLGDVPAATAILDRFLAQAEIVQMQGKSYRMHQRAERLRHTDTPRA